MSKLCTVDVSPVLYLHYCQSSVRCVFQHIVSRLLPAQCVMCVSPVLHLHYCQCLVMSVLVMYCTHVCLHYCQCSVLCVSPALCLHYCQRRVQSCIVFTLLPAYYAKFVSPVLCLQYCQCSVLCNDYNKSFVVFAQCTAIAVCCAGATISPLIIFILLFFIIFTHFQ